MLTRRLLGSLLVAGAFAATPQAHAVLLGLTVNEPTIDVAAGSVITYNSTTGVVTVSGTPQLLQRTLPFLFGEFVGTSSDDEKLFTIQFRLNTSGQFVGGVDGPDLIVKGAIDVNFDGVVDYDGVLLEAEVTQFGFQDGAPGANDRFDIRLGSVTGLMSSLFSGQDLSVSIDSEPSPDYPAPFADSFVTSWSAPAKAALGTVTPLVADACTLKVEAFCSVNGGPDKSTCRIALTRSPKHWEHVTHYHKGNMFRIYKYGMHGDPVPSWASRYPATNVKFTYIVSNVGVTPVTGLQVIDSFDVPVGGAPASLAAGQSVTLMRTEALRDGLIDSVIVTGESGTAGCMAKDSVAIKDKIRKERAHDRDRFEDKGNHADRR